MENYISYDLGTGGVKASLFDENLKVLANSFIEYETTYPLQNYHEQAPEDWWKGIIQSTRILLEKTKVNPAHIVSLAVCGHSLVTVPIDAEGKELVDRVPIWSDTRAGTEAESFFRRFDEKEWYMTTGNGFPAPCYSIFKLMWLKKHKPEIYNRTYKVLGSKDYINYRLTGKIYTDYSYASGIGAYDLKAKGISPGILQAAEIRKDIFPEIVSSHTVLGTLLPAAAAQLGLTCGTKVACGGVDNACMALGSVGNEEGRVYTSLGSSSWIAVNSKEPVLDFDKKPYVFAHIDEEIYTSAFSIFAGGSSLRWVRDNLCRDLLEEADTYEAMTEEIKKVPIGSGGVLFNPSLAGGTSQDRSVNIRGAFLGLSLSAGRAELIRAAMEGIAMNLKISLDNLKEHTCLNDQIQFCGGGAKNKVWMQMFADIFNMNIVKTNIDQNAASIGAAAIAAKAVGKIQDYGMIRELHVKEFECTPEIHNVDLYKKLQKVFLHTTIALSDLGDYMKENSL
ncbi:FGGY family carbohydrate kinase [Blautia schinkii]|nr:FGGY family carbohydrate kinase [Blautia schinkii]